MKPTTVLALTAVAAVAGFLIVRKAKEAGADALDYAAQKLDVTSDQNVFYQGANKVVQAVSGDSTNTVGTWLYNLTHADENLSTMPKQPRQIAGGSYQVQDALASLLPSSTYQTIYSAENWRQNAG